METPRQNKKLSHLLKMAQLVSGGVGIHTQVARLPSPQPPSLDGPQSHFLPSELPSNLYRQGALPTAFLSCGKMLGASSCSVAGGP